MKTEFVWRCLRWIAVCLIAVTPVVQASDDIAADWRELLEKGDVKAIEQTYVLTARIQNHTGKVDADVCRAEAAAIEAALQVNRVGLALWQMAQDCARATGDEALAEKRQQRMEALLSHALAGRAVKQGLVPIRILAVRDAEAVALATGQKILYQLYMPYDGGRHLVLVLGLWDEQNQRETLLEFDYMDSSVQLRRDLPQSEFPMFRRVLIKAIAQAAEQNAPDSPLLMLKSYEEIARGPEASAADAYRRLDAQAQKGSLMAGMLLAMTCSEKQRPGCREQAVDALLPLAEKRQAMALVMLAYVYARNSSKPDDLRAAQALLTQADQRLGNIDGSLMFVRLAAARGDSEKMAGLVEKTVEKAAQQGNLRAGVLLPSLQNKPLAGLKGEDLQRLTAAADAGNSLAQFNLALVLLTEKKTDKAVQWMRRAAEGGYPLAQHWMGLMTYAGEHGVVEDKALGLRWLKLAGHGGHGAACTLVGQHYASLGDDLATLQQAQLWLQSGMQLNNVSAMVNLAVLYSRDVKGLEGDSATAVKIYKALIDRSDDVMARRGLAALLRAGRGVEKNLAEAETLLRPSALKGDVESQISLALVLNEEEQDEARRTEGVEWLRKAAASGNSRARGLLADALWWGKGTAADRPAARTLWSELMAANAAPAVFNNFAWAHCTPREDQWLDAVAGLKAIQPHAAPEDAPLFFISTLAACQAASGDFPGAIASQQRAIAWLEKRKDQQAYADLLPDLRTRLEKYQAGKREDSGEF